MQRTYSSIDKNRAELAWVNETPDPNKCGCRNVRCCFQREAEMLASLNHPNIAAIYDLEEANDIRFLVLELVDGETLAERIQRGPVPVEEALNLAKILIAT